MGRHVDYALGVVVRLSFDDLRAFRETRSLRVHLSSVNGGARVERDCAT